MFTFLKFIGAAIFLGTACPVFAQDTIALRSTSSPTIVPPFITVFKPTVRSNGIAVVITSGGSYGRVANMEEGYPAARKLQEAGFTAFVLTYRTPQGRDTTPLSDAQVAIRYVKTNMKKYGIKKNRIGLMGFSAGGHLASTAGIHWREQFDTSRSDVNARPDFLVLVYPVISFADSLTHQWSRNNFLGKDQSPERIRHYSNEWQVDSLTPPTFIVHAIDDGVVKVENSLYLEAALRQKKVPVELFLYAKGNHGFGAFNHTAEVQWIDRCMEWIRKQ
ncbi:MAG: alpha/beta hydrolase [Chitinophagaceae bacterium]|nr:alpha/beta hydrolase [Chitinophagaceae bacterium]